MKKNILLKILFVAPALLLSCDDDSESVSTDFNTLASSYNESQGSGTLTIPFRNAASVSNLSVVLGGTATEGEDYSLVGITEEGVQLSINADGQFEENETVRVQLISPGDRLKGNAIHTVTIVSSCADAVNAEYFLGSEFNMVEYYDETEEYHYDWELEQDPTNPNKYWTDNFWDSGLPAYIVYDPATKKVSFPTQTPVATFPTRIITTVTPATLTNNCDDFTIVVSYRGLTFENRFHRRVFSNE